MHSSDQVLLLPSWCQVDHEVIRTTPGVAGTIWTLDRIRTVSPIGVTLHSGVKMGVWSVGERLYSGEDKMARALLWSFTLRWRRDELSRVSTALKHTRKPANSLIKQGRDAVVLEETARREWSKALLDLSVDRRRPALVH